MDDAPTTPDIKVDTLEQPQKTLTVDTLTDEQLQALAAAWDLVEGSDTPMADLRSKLSYGGVVDALSKYNANNIELRALATSARGALEHRHAGSRKTELEAIVAAVAGKTSPDEKRAALVDLLGHDIGEPDVDRFIADAQNELDELHKADAPAVTPDVTGMPPTTNRELAGEVSDLLDGQLMVDATDRVHYGAGATALGERVGGKFVSPSQLRDIAAHADQIRDGLAELGRRDKPDMSPEDELSGDEIDQDAMQRRYDAHNHEDEAPAEGGVIGDEAIADSAPTDLGEAPTEDSDSLSDTTPKELDTPITPKSPDTLSVSFIDESDDAEALARDAARARWRETLQSGGRFRRFVKNLWMGENGVAGPYVYRKYYHEALAQIQQAGDVLVHESDDATARRRAQLATIERFQEGFLHDEAGEQREELAGDSAFGMAVKDLIRRYAEGEFADEAAFMEERGRVLEQLHEAGHDDLLGEGGVRIDNMFLIAEQVRAMADHGDSIDRVLEGMKIYSGEARSHVRTEAHLNMIDRAINGIDRTRFGGLASPETLGAAAAIALGIFQVGRGGIATIAGVTVPGVVGGGLAALRENKRLKDDRMLHGREMATGKEYDQNARRRVEIETARYESVAAQDLTRQLDILFDNEGEMTPDQVQQAYKVLAAVEARVRMSDRRGVDLVSFSDATMVEVERQALDAARANAKVALAGRLGQLPADFRRQMGIEDTDTVDAALDRFTDPVTAIEQDMSDKDRAFNKIRLRRIGTAAAIGAGTSFLMGVGAQEIAAFAIPGYEGFVEHVVNPNSANGATKQTILEGLARQLRPKTYDAFALGSHGNALEMPSGYSVVQEGKNAFSILDSSGNHVIDHVALNKNGSLTHESILELRQHNIEIEDTGKLVAQSVPSSKTMTIPEYNKTHAADVTRITRDFWNDNNTPAPKFDHNELGLSYGGKGGTGIGAHGSIRMSVAGMTEGGSWHGSHHVSWTDAAEHGKLKLAITGSRGTQTEAYMVDIKPDGSINIPADSPAAKFFSVENGHVKFHGGFIEAVETRGTSHGVTHVAPLATVSGDHSLHHIVDKVPGSERYVPHLKLTPPDSLQVEGFAGPPVVMRNPLETVNRRRNGAPYELGYGPYGQVSAEILRAIEQERSPRLREDAGAKLELGSELDWHRDLIAKADGGVYTKEIDDAIDQCKELLTIDKNTRAIVTIPVGAAQEADNIYRTLSLYGHQEGVPSNAYKILLHVNWIDADRNNPEKAARIQKTQEEIERARRDFPGLDIAVITSVWNKERIDKGEYGDRLIGHVSQKMYDVAMSAARRAIQEGRLGADDDLLVIKNDADALGMDKRYIEKMVRAFEDHPEADTFTGAVYWGAERHQDLPGFAFVSKFYELGRIAAKLKSVNAFQSSFGVNIAVRMSTFAAVGGIGHYSDQRQSPPDDLIIAERVHAARTSSFGSNGRRRNGYLEREPDAGLDYSYHRHVLGASIDSDASRMEASYAAGKTIVGTWVGATSGNGEMVNRVSGLTGRNTEDIYKEPDKVMSRIEDNISAVITSWLPNESQYRAALAFMLPNPDHYRIIKEKDRTVFRLTPQGKSWLIGHIKRDGSGKKDPYGRRTVRRLYGIDRRARGTRGIYDSKPHVAPLVRG